MLPSVSSCAGVSGPGDAKAEPGLTRVPKAGRAHGDEAQRGPKLAPDVMHPPL